ncbi:hypothetical protein MIZ03_1435 [Rhodoferax lithotrophicus]|uniref:Uncharacterized protein n=1 Tax=Rhodoferax lithotrophicus TaxID=2798804 RepID=A0ABM7MK28_9BURK|nr:hypothetical protein MIZ03_1435 [Rhodoferax sp. MIZ03]
MAQWARERISVPCLRLIFQRQRLRSPPKRLVARDQERQSLGVQFI